MSTDVNEASVKSVVLRPGTRIAIINDDIVNGEGGSPTCCAVALALRRLIPSDYYPYVVSDWVEIVRRSGPTVQRFDLPDAISQWVRDFDELCEYEDCTDPEDFARFFEEHNDGEPYEVEPFEPIEFVVPA